MKGLRMNLIDLAEENYTKFGELVSVIFEDLEYTNAQMLQFSKKLANGLENLGVGAGDKVMVMLLNCPEVLISYQAILRVGGIIVPVVFLLGEREIAHLLRDSESVAMITSKDLLNKIDGYRDTVDTLEHVIIVEDEDIPQTTKFWEIVDGSSDERGPGQVKEDDLAVILYTAGTTGTPKGVMLNHGNLYSNAISCASVADVEPNDVGLHVLPLSHSYGLTAMNTGYMFDNRRVMMRWFDTEETFRLIEKHKVTVFAGVPAMYAMMLNSPVVDKYELSSLRRCSSGSAPLPVEIRRAFQEKFDCTIREGYGLSEAAPVVSTHFSDRPQKPGSIGQPIPGVGVKIIDEKDNEVPVGEIGELIVKGPNVSPGYYKMPAETANTFKKGWLYTGDMAKMDQDGDLFIVERKKDLIIRGGFNIYPRDVEEVLYQHPALLDAAVIGVPDPVMGEDVKAFLVLKEGQAATEQDIIDYCQQHLGKYKCPKHIEFIENIPRNPIGKVLRKVLRERDAKQSSLKS
jgi:long-chain acyl-CoA synthetase